MVICVCVWVCVLLLDWVMENLLSVCVCVRELACYTAMEHALSVNCLSPGPCHACMCHCVCVYVCVCMCVSIYACLFVCECVYVCICVCYH